MSLFGHRVGSILARQPPPVGGVPRLVQFSNWVSGSGTGVTYTFPVATTPGSTLLWVRTNRNATGSMSTPIDGSNTYQEFTGGTFPIGTMDIWYSTLTSSVSSITGGTSSGGTQTPFSVAVEITAGSPVRAESRSNAWSASHQYIENPGWTEPDGFYLGIIANFSGTYITGVAPTGFTEVPEATAALATACAHYGERAIDDVVAFTIGAGRSMNAGFFLGVQ